MKRNSFRWKSPFAALALTAGLMLPGCLGPFNTWHQVLHWNRSVSDSKWVGELIFIGTVIIPVYSIAFLLDAVIFNSIEFWGGKNPISPASYSNTGTLEPGAGSSVETDPGTIEVSPLPAEG
jgi:hypothetical protein